ncbi:carbon-nitrogen hydrolase family protein [Vibrio sp. SCSIO 43135]|uniref:carbon-nitrogen hydrolase family protein n=1 Tax=Vibrio sp. SCSIO 43135 TaxID=2819096 RepID=UPI002074DCF5|nr:carbon-nitrogen hydrolase family protein [Vibrio sp. SCSIO 43135]USD42838.1 carbon-nitrogen hydrolase family protein [Vibrio sp. SCSIO 43135]
MEGVSVTLVQLCVEYKNKQRNLASLAQQLKQCDSVGDITLLPEMFSTGYIFDSPEEIQCLSEEFTYSPTIDALTELAQQYSTLFVAGVAEKDGDNYYNSVVVVDGTGLKHTYRKISQNRIDKRYFDRGSELLTFSHKGLNFGVAICFDIWFPEIMRGYQNADVILHPANFGGQQSFAIAHSRALENGQHILTCNRVGEDVTSEFTAHYCGSSRAYNAQGENTLTLGESAACETVVINDLSIAPQYNGISLNQEIDEIRSLLNSKPLS